MISTEIILYVMLGAVIGMMYALRRVIILEHRIIEIEKRIINLDDTIIRLLKKKK